MKLIYVLIIIMLSSCAYRAVLDVPRIQYEDKITSDSVKLIKQNQSRVVKTKKKNGITKMIQKDLQTYNGLYVENVRLRLKKNFRKFKVTYDIYGYLKSDTINGFRKN